MMAEIFSAHSLTQSGKKSLDLMYDMEIRKYKLGLSSVNQVGGRWEAGSTENKTNSAFKLSLA